MENFRKTLQKESQASKISEQEEKALNGLIFQSKKMAESMLGVPNYESKDFAEMVAVFAFLEKKGIEWIEKVLNKTKKKAETSSDMGLFVRGLTAYDLKNGYPPYIEPHNLEYLYEIN